MDGSEPVGLRSVKRSSRRAASTAAFWNALALGTALLVAVAVGEACLRAPPRAVT